MTRTTKIALKGGRSLNEEYEIFYIYADGRKACVSWPKFKSALDATKSLALLAGWGIPKDVIKVVAEDSNGDWICEVTRKSVG